MIEEFGIYQIKNNINDRVYVGSTTQSFRKRWNLHRHHLKNNKHKNAHLQYAWNKYSEQNFSFEIIEICKDKDIVLDREQFWIDSMDFETMYNINPLATGGLQFGEDVLKRRAETLRKLNEERSERYSLWKDGILLDENLTDIEKSLFKKWSTHKPWNKGLKYKSTDHLKVPKKRKGDRTSFKEQARENAPEIEVYDMEGIFLGKFRSAKDLEEFSMTDECNFNVKSRFKGETRMGVSSKMLRAPNINVACRKGKPYKNLIFKFSKDS